MQHNITFTAEGKVLPRSLNIGSGLSNLPYVPHPLQIAGHIPMPVMGAPTVAGMAGGTRVMRFLNRVRIGW